MKLSIGIYVSKIIRIYFSLIFNINIIKYLILIMAYRIRINTYYQSLWVSENIILLRVLSHFIAFINCSLLPTLLIENEQE